MKRTLIFDFDGTLADSFGVAMSVFHQLTGDKHTLTPLEIAALRGLPALQVLKKLGIPLWRAPFLMTKGRKLMHTRIDELKPFPGLPGVIKRLHAEGYPMLILSSNSAENITSFLQEHEMAKYFERVYGGVGLFSKARFMRRVMRVNGLATADCIYIGDEARDVHAAVRVGLECIAVTWGYNSKEALEAAEPSELADRPKDLLRILGAKQV